MMTGAKKREKSAAGEIVVVGMGNYLCTVANISTVGMGNYLQQSAVQLSSGIGNSLWEAFAIARSALETYHWREGPKNMNRGSNET